MASRLKLWKLWKRRARRRAAALQTLQSLRARRLSQVCNKPRISVVLPVSQRTGRLWRQLWRSWTRARMQTLHKTSGCRMALRRTRGWKPCPAARRCTDWCTRQRLDGPRQWCAARLPPQRCKLPSKWCVERKQAPSRGWTSWRRRGPLRWRQCAGGSKATLLQECGIRCCACTRRRR